MQGLTEVDEQAGAGGTPARAVPAARWLLFWMLAIGGAGFDLATKAVVFERVGPPGAPAASVVGRVVELRTSHNTGALWGIGGAMPYGSLLFAVLSIVAAVFIVYWLFALGHAVDGLQTAALGLIMAGAIGNCYDRLAFGYVRDFVHVHVDSVNFDFPIFNFADNMLVAGAAILMLMAVRAEPTADRPPAPDRPAMHT